MVKMWHNYSSTNHIKSDGLLAQHRHLLSTDVRGIDTMLDHTLPLLSLQPHTKEIPLSQGQVAIVDAADYEHLGQFKWYAYRHRKTWYVKRNVTLDNGKRTTAFMHREILGSPQGMAVDHINGDGLDNRRANLRPATALENRHNQGLSSNNKSGYKGVSWSDDCDKWRARITLNGKEMHLGVYSSPRDAALEYNRVARELYGEFARLNEVE